VQNEPNKGAQSASASKTKAKQHPAPAPSTSATTSTGAKGDVSAAVARQAPAASTFRPPSQSLAGGGAGFGGPTLASLPPRVGLGKNASTTSLHRPASSSTAGAAGSGARPSGLGGGVKIVGGTQGVRRPGLQKNVVVRQQLHGRPND